MSYKTYTQPMSRVTPQWQPVLGKDQVKNNEGGYVFALDIWKRLQRFLILGTDGGTFYVSEKNLTQENAQVLAQCIKVDGKRTVDMIVEISDSGRAAKNDPAIFALAMCSGVGDVSTRKYALENLDKVCRIATHLYHFATYVEQFRGWGAGLRKAVGKWYLEKPLDRLEYQLIKYRQRDGWSHRDLLRLSHPHVTDDVRNLAFNWVVSKEKFGDLDSLKSSLPLIWAYEQAQGEKDEKKLVKLITDFRLPMEAIPTEKRSNTVLEALLPNLGLTGLIRNLASFTEKGILTQHSDATKFVVERLLSAEGIKKARVHPIQLLGALLTYNSGAGIRGNKTWTPVGVLVDALDDGFYLSFGNVEPTNVRLFLGLDLSASMTWEENKIKSIPGLDARTAAAAMAMVTMKVEKDWGIYGFTVGQEKTYNYGYGYRFENHNFLGWISPMSISPKMRLDSVVQYINQQTAGGTDCSLPMVYAKKNKIPVDAFVIYTDNETKHGSIHPFQALKEYRQAMGIDARLIVVGMTATKFSIADPSDDKMLDVVGFDTNAPQAISNFAAGKI